MPPALGALLRLYREHYRGCNVPHFHEVIRREHGVTLSYSTAKKPMALYTDRAGWAFYTPKAKVDDRARSDARR